MKLNCSKLHPQSSDIELIELIEALISTSLAEYFHGVLEDLRFSIVLVANDWALVCRVIHSGDLVM